MVNIGLLGLGTVGTGVVEIINERKDKIKKTSGRDINIRKVMVKNLNKERDIDLSQIVLTQDFEDILNDTEINVIIEVTGDVESSYKYIIEGLKAGKHIVTANKAVVSKYFEEFSSLAAEKDLAFLYEASVGGGIPVLKPLREQIELNEIDELQGILNGTCNYILTRMINEDKNYEEVLKIAQNLGYAEADPSSDVEGNDTMRKLRILATLGLQGKVTEEDVLVYGISSIGAIDIENIKRMDSTVKLIAGATKYEDGYTAIVQPTIVENNNYFANVNMAYNSVAFRGDNVGELKFYGSGAGKLPTANAVLSDVLDIGNNSYRKGNPLGQRSLKNLNSEIKGKFYLRVSYVNEETSFALKGIANRVLCNDKDMAIITNDMRLFDIKDLLLKLEIKECRYFLAKIME